MTYVRDDEALNQTRPAPTPGPTWAEPPLLGSETPRFHADDLLHAILARRLPSPEAAADFLDPRPRPAPDPHRLPGLSAAADRVATALRHGEAIGVFGDYDTDGVTSAALLTLALRAASGGTQPVATRLPSRDEGYGLSRAGVEDVAAAGAKLLIAVDCGSKDHLAVARAQELGLDVVILDHHRLTAAPPEGAIVASAQLHDDAPYRELSAAGAAYLLATALAGAGFDAGSGAGREPVALLDLAMIGIIGDVSPLMGVNRALVRDGLRRMRAEPRPGLRELAEAARLDVRALTSGDIAFRISPRLNAPGRLGDPRPAFDLLLAGTRGEAQRLALMTEQANQQRKVQQDRVLRDIDAALAADPSQLERRVLIFAGQEWQPGIVGLAAGKLADRFGRPVIVLSRHGDVVHGSARSVVGFDIATALAAASELLLRHGGHERAAGLALLETNVAELAEGLQTAIAASPAQPPGPARLQIDADVAPSQLTLEVARRLQLLAPFGEGNPLPMLRISRLPILDYVTMGRERQHLKLRVGTGGRGVEAILWNGAARSRELLGARLIDLVGTIETSVWNGLERVQVKIADFRQSGA